MFADRGSQQIEVEERLGEDQAGEGGEKSGRFANRRAAITFPPIVESCILS